jgi:FtsZ-interacting cell division protein ZipA
MVFNFNIGAEDGEKYLVGIIVGLIILVIILLVILAYFIYQNRRRKSSKANPENKSKDKNNSEDIYENPDNDDANYEEVENEESTYTALKRTGEEENDGHLYAHLIGVHTDYVNQKETGF